MFQLRLRDIHQLPTGRGEQVVLCQRHPSFTGEAARTDDILGFA
jgi:hypothetical protein